MTNKPPRPITAEDLERLDVPALDALRDISFNSGLKSPTGRLPRPWPEIWRDKPDIAAGPQKPTFLGADFGEIEARAVAAIYAGTLTEVAPIPKSAWDDVNPNPYYGYTFPHIRLMVLADNAITEQFVPYAAHCFNQAVRGGIVFG